MRNLSENSIKIENLPKFNKLLTKFVKETEELYGAEAIKINIHQFLHLIYNDVELWRPLWTHNSFIYESMNSILVKFLHGTQFVPKSAIHAINCMQQMSVKEYNIKFKNEEANNLFKKLQKNETK
jgi:hypothetical protein